MKTKKLVILAMLAAIAYLSMLLIKIPIVATASYLKYEPKDVIITLAGFMFGPLSALICSVVVCLIEALTVGSTGWIGAVMDFVATASFTCTAALFYKSKRTLGRAVIGLVCGVCVMTVVMLLWNYFLTPIYTGYPREAVSAMLPTVFLPFNLIKGAINASLVMLLYKPLVITLRRADLIPLSASAGSGSENRYGRVSLAVLLGSAAVLAVSVLFAMWLAGVF